MSEKNIRVFDLKEDKKIDAKCLLTDINIGYYTELIKKNLENLDIQRGKMLSKKRDIYRRLTEDFQDGAIIPPISLVSNAELTDVIKSISDIKELENLINVRMKDDTISILDGLQRTYCILNIIDDLTEYPEKLIEFKERRIRAELWYELKFNALLYKMLVLNTGQVKMSMRHQIEILNIPLKEKILQIAKDKELKEVELSTYKDAKPTKDKYKYNFAYIVEALTSFTTFNPIVDKSNEIIKELEKMQFIEEHSTVEKLQSDDEIKEFLDLLFRLDDSLWKKYGDGLNHESEKDDEEEKKIEWTARNNFINSAPFLSGFFASFGRSYKKIDNYKKMKDNFFEAFNSKDDDPLQLKFLSKILEDEKRTSKKFGDTLRNFFFKAFNEYFRGETNFIEIWKRGIEG